MVGNVNPRWEKDDGWSLPPGTSGKCQSKLTGQIRRGTRGCAHGVGPRRALVVGCHCLGWSQCCLRPCTGEERSPFGSSGASPGSAVSSPTRRHRLDKSVLMLALSCGRIPWARGKGRRGVRPSEPQAPPRIWALVDKTAWDSPQILTSPHSSILRP